MYIKLYTKRLEEEVNIQTVVAHFLYLLHYIVFLDTLSVIARSIGEETFAPIAKECADFGMGLLNSVDDPDLRRCV